METKDVQNSSAAGGRLVNEAKPSRLQPVRALTGKPVSIKSEAVNVSVNAAVTQSLNSEVRGKANQVLNVINVASEATGEIDKLVQGIEGIVKQAETIVSDSGGTGSRVPVLEKEARQLVNAIRKRAETEAPNGVRPLAGDKIKLELEEKLGRSLDVILPDEASGAFGISDIRLSTKDAIINTRASIEEAKARVQAIRDAIDDTFKEVQSIVSSLEVAYQNSEAARASIRDVDQAAQVVSETTRLISRDPRAAVDSMAIRPSSIDLLKG